MATSSTGPAAGMASSRRATHAGSWYTSSRDKLGDQLQGWLDAAGEVSVAPCRAIITPHAGYSYSGACAGYAYKQIDPEKVHRVFLLGPSHHEYIRGCALSSFKEYETPLGNLHLDQGVYADLQASGLFETMPPAVDEAEHSLEMQLPYIAKVFAGRDDVSLVPILVGDMAGGQRAEYAALLAPHLADPACLFVISSDFCHWGARFGYQYIHPACKGCAIHEAIEHLDREGMALVEGMDPIAFSTYLRKHKNTICGRNPILLLLETIQKLAPETGRGRLEFVHYAQSSACKVPSDSSVSYAAAAFAPAP